MRSELLAEPDAKAIAGGQSLIPVMKLRIARPSLVVDISRLDLRGVEERDGELHIGPLTTWGDLIDSEVLRPPGARGDRGVRSRDRRPAGTQPRDDRRQRRARRPGVGHARRAARARREAAASLRHRRARGPLADVAPRPVHHRARTAGARDRHRRSASVAGLRLCLRGGRASCVGVRARRRGRTRRPHRRRPWRSPASARRPFVLSAAIRARRSPRRRSSATASRRPSTAASSRRSSPSAPSSCARARGGDADRRAHEDPPMRRHADRRLATAHRRAGQGHGRDALRGRRLRPRPAARAARALRPRRTHASAASTRTPRSPSPASSPCSLASDLPIASTGTDRTSEPLAREEVVFAGQPVALVVAETEAAAEDGAETRRRRLRATRGGRRRRGRDGARRRARAHRRGERTTKAGDLESIHRRRRRPRPGGRPRRAALGERARSHHARARETSRRRSPASDAIVEGTFRTPWVYQAYLEPQVCTAWLEPSGTLVVSTSTQGSFVTRRELARAFDLPLERIRVIAEPLGGAFGGKFALVEPLAVGAALALRRPVRLVLTRTRGLPGDEPGLGAGDAPEGRRTRGRHVHRDRGADDRRSRLECRLGRRGHHAPLLVAGPYRWEAHDLRGYGVQTNRFTFGAYRAPGRADRRVRARVAPRRARRKLGLDPIELRLKNAVVEGDVGVSGKPYPDDRRGRGARADSRAPALGCARLAPRGRRGRHGR